MSTWLELVTLIWPGKSSWRYTQILHWTMEKWEVLSSWRSRNKLKFPVRKELGNFSQFKNHWARTKVLFDHLRLSGEILGDVSYLIHVNCHSPPQKKSSPPYSYNTWVSWQVGLFGGCFGGVHRKAPSNPDSSLPPRHTWKLSLKPPNTIWLSLISRVISSCSRPPTKKTSTTPEIERIDTF